MRGEGERIELELGHMEWRHRRSARLAVTVAIVLLILGLIVVCWIYLFSPPGVVRYGDRNYRKADPWEEYQSRFPGVVEEPSDMQRVAGLSLRYRAILDTPDPPDFDPEGISTVICVQALDGRYWTYSLIGGP